MARKLAHGGQSNETEESSGNDPPDGGSSGNRTIGRRQYLRLGGAVAATVLSIAGSVPTVVAAEAGGDAAEHCLRIRGSGTASTYELTVDGELVPGAGSDADAAARVSECNAEGAITTGDRRYRFSGALRDLQVDGDATVTVDGVEVR
ncbi:hypothetical protein [Halobellus marinus]|uniref:hypothetical protein n=1 Tax=Halobellus TaxID=1073986 RepID=UPI0028AB500F|nr:hypothetical protein [Halobellus sp. DFY28]